MHPVMAWLKSPKKKKDKVFGASAKIGKDAPVVDKKGNKKGSGGPSKKVVKKDADKM